MEIVPKKKRIRRSTEAEKKVEYRRLRYEIQQLESRINDLAIDAWGGAGPDCIFVPEGVRHPVRIRLIREDAGVLRTVNANTHTNSKVDKMLGRCMNLARG